MTNIFTPKSQTAIEEINVYLLRQRQRECVCWCMCAHSSVACVCCGCMLQQLLLGNNQLCWHKYSLCFLCAVKNKKKEASATDILTPKSQTAIEEICI